MSRRRGRSTLRGNRSANAAAARRASSTRPKRASERTRNASRSSARRPFENLRACSATDASFTIYEDEGDTYNYETGQYAQIPITWNDAARALTIGARTGSYSGMPTTRTFSIVFVGASHGNGVAVTATPDQVVNYNGTQAIVSAK